MWNGKHNELIMGHRGKREKTETTCFGRVATCVFCTLYGMGTQNWETLLGGSRFHTPTHSTTNCSHLPFIAPYILSPEFCSQLVLFNPRLPRISQGPPAQ